MTRWKAPLEVQMPCAGDDRHYVMVDVVHASDADALQQQVSELQGALREVLDNGDELLFKVLAFGHPEPIAVRDWQASHDKALALLPPVAAVGE